MFSDDPASAFYAREPQARSLSLAQPLWTEADGPLPALYVSHGAPPLFDDDVWIEELLTWSMTMPKPRAILIVSAHWETAPIGLSATDAGTPLVYDFGGFHPHYYAMTYPTPDSRTLADRVRALLPDGTAVHEHTRRGLDHGAWVPLKVMYPLGDVPVLQMSLPTHDPQSLLELGRRLQPLREDGVLVIGSGFMTHGLPYITREMWMGTGSAGWSVDFDVWASEALSRGDLDELAAFASRAPGMPFAHPTPEHFTPLFVTLGAGADDGAIETAIEGFVFGLSKRSFSVT